MPVMASPVFGALTGRRNLRWLVPAGLTAAGVGTGLTASYLLTWLAIALTGFALNQSFSLTVTLDRDYLPTPDRHLLGSDARPGHQHWRAGHPRSRRPRRRDQPAPCRHHAGRLPGGRPGAGPRKPQGNGKLRSLAFREGGIEGDRPAGNASGGIW